VIAIGPQANLALLEVSRRGSLSGASVVAMGGWLGPLGDGLPGWGPERDWNVQFDTRAAEIVAATANLTLVPLAVTVRTHLRAGELPRLRAAGPLGALIADQSQARATDVDMGKLGRDHAGLPDDVVNFHHDPLTCAVALGWPGAVIEDLSLRPVLDGHVLRYAAASDGRSTGVVVDVDTAAFAQTWLEAVEAVG